jgi:Na+/H+ antiporter NhaD/arsenite permease-like protein
MAKTADVSLVEIFLKKSADGVAVVAAFIIGKQFIRTPASIKEVVSAKRVLKPSSQHNFRPVIGKSCGVGAPAAGYFMQRFALPVFPNQPPVHPVAEYA